MQTNQLDNCIIKGDEIDSAFDRQAAIKTVRRIMRQRCSNSRPWRYRVGLQLAGLVLAVVTVGGCTSVAGPESAGVEQSGQSEPVSEPVSEPTKEAGANASRSLTAVSEVVKDRKKWILPTDPYFDLRTFDYQIEHDLWEVRDCMKDAGFDYRVHIDNTRPAPETEQPTGNGRQLFDEEIAAKYGYQLAPDPRMINPVQPDEDVPGYQEKWDECYGQSVVERHKVPEPTQVERDLQKGYQALFRYSGVPQLDEAAARWRECMAPLGIVDLPASPWIPGARPPESLVEAWNWGSGEPASADQIRVAVFDAKCRESSGWFDELYDYEWQIADSFVKAHQKDLDAMKRGRDARVAELNEFIVAHKSGEQ
ncbi:hypothetical protein [Scrofimicrobium sp. R131]|uniref:Uncharacterized protein n=1 Tax=Scrofimicrobium appendicitidis TaxID=3079930 RepID=A0AAU7V6W0_9ACTO